MVIVGCLEGCYEVQDVEFGKIYRWCPESILIECDCGENATVTGFETTCVWCGVDHASTIREQLLDRRLPDDEATHPWRYAGDHANAGIPY